MATSGTVSTTVFNTAKVVEHAYGRCRIARQEITGEKLTIARELLYLRLSQLANRGIPLWAVEKEIIAIYQGEQSVNTPIGTVNVRNLNLRRITRLTGSATSSAGTAANAFDDDFATSCTTLADGWIALTLDSGTRISTVGFLPAASGTWSYQIEGDGAVLYTATDETIVAGQWVWFDLEGVDDFTEYTIQATGGTVLDIAELVFANNPNEVPVALINRDDYAYLPDKTFQSQPTQYWLDKQRLRPVIMLWPAPNLEVRYWQLVGYLQRQIQDVGTLVQEIEVRQSDLLAITARLAADIALSDKAVDKDWVPIVLDQARIEMADLWDGESDDAPISLQANIAPYTR